MKVWKGPSLRDEDGYRMCFACGRENPIGLKLEVRRDGDGVSAEFTPDERHQGWPGVVHGGIINTLLDEAMAYAAFYRGLYCVTARMEVRLRGTAMVGQRLTISAGLTRHTRRLVEAGGGVRLDDGTLVAEGKATMYIVEQD